MKSWLAYCGAFGCAVMAAFMVSALGFRILMSGGGSDAAGLILFGTILPVSAGLISFGVTYYAFTKQSFGAEAWLVAVSFVAVATAVCVGLVVVGVLQSLTAIALLLATLFFGGRFMTQRASRA